MSVSRTRSPYWLSIALTIACVALADPGLARDRSTLVPGTGTIEYAFTPGDDAAGLVAQAIETARDQVLVQAFSFTHREIAMALIHAHLRGVDVQVIVDPQQVELIEHNVTPLLLDHGVPVLTDAEHGAAHNKVILVDPAGRKPAIVTGSFNFTHAAQYRNAENLLILRGNVDLTRAYLENWMRHRAHARPLGGAERD